MSDDALVAFWTARLDEDEAAAKEAASPLADAGWTALDHCDQGSIVVDSSADLVAAARSARSYDSAVAAHIARHDPARALREVDAGRKLLDLYERAKSYRDQVFARPEPRSISDEMRAVTQMMALEQVLKLRADVYSDHPDYRQE